MTRLRTNVSAVPASSKATATLRSLLRRVDCAHTPVVTHDEVKYWPVDLFNQFEAVGLLAPYKAATCVTCDSCADQPSIDVDVIDYPSGPLAVGKCPNCGVIRFPVERLQQWQVSFVGLAVAIATSLKLKGEVIVDVPGRLAFVGSVVRKNMLCEVLIYGSRGESDHERLIERSHELVTSSKPILLTLCDPGLVRGYTRGMAVVAMPPYVQWCDGSLHVGSRVLAATPRSPAETAPASDSLPDTERAVLEFLSARHPDPQPVSAIVAGGGYRRTATKDAISRLEERGLVGKPAGTSRQGRGLTEAGRRLAKELQSK